MKNIFTTGLCRDYRPNCVIVPIRAESALECHDSGMSRGCLAAQLCLAMVPGGPQLRVNSCLKAG